MKSLAYFLILFSFSGFSQDFITTWQTDIVDAANARIDLPIKHTGGTYDIDWGDGTQSNGVNTIISGQLSKTYDNPGAYTVSIDFTNASGVHIDFDDLNGGGETLITSIDQWGGTPWASMNESFAGCRNLVLNASDTPDLSQVTDMQSMFRSAAKINGDLSSWDVSNVQLMNGLFSGASAFNGNISTWNVSSVTDMSSMFLAATSFNQNLNSWNVGNVINMSAMFDRAISFNGEIGSWDVSKVENMNRMFSADFDGTNSFNQNLNDWNVSSVQNMSYMFSDASTFNQNLAGWDVSSVTNMSNMFAGASSFNQNLNSWNVSSVTDMSRMFDRASSFNGEIGNWNVGNVQNMSLMFLSATSFNQNISSWNISNVTNLVGIFSLATSFNQDLNNWDVSGLIILSAIFDGATSFNGDISSWNVGNAEATNFLFRNATSFNQDISGWDVSKVRNMSSMFSGATSFNQDISSWNVGNVQSMNSMFESTTSFNQDISNWNVSSALTTIAMFLNATSFNQNLNSWNVSNVTNMTSMFFEATSFDQDLGGWDITGVTTCTNMLDGSGISRSNYESLLAGWAVQDVQSNVSFGALGLTYCAEADSRDRLINEYNWTIDGDSRGITTEVINLGEDIHACVGDELTFSIDESALTFETYTISTIFGNTATDEPLTITFDETFAATASTQDVFVTIELTDQGGCFGSDQVQLFDNTMKNWGIGGIITNDPGIVVNSTILPETHDTFEWDFGDGTTNTTDINPSHTYQANGDYTITLTVSNECGDESLTSSVSITAYETEVPLGIDASRILIYPNPTNGVLYFEVSGELEVQLFSLDGRNVYGGNSSNGNIDISDLSAGQYIVHFLEDKKLLGTQKIVKTN